MLFSNGGNLPGLGIFHPIETLPLVLGPELPKRRLGVTKNSSPKLGVNSQLLPLTKAAQTCDFLHSPGSEASGLCPIPPRCHKGTGVPKPERFCSPLAFGVFRTQSRKPFLKNYPQHRFKLNI